MKANLPSVINSKQVHQNLSCQQDSSRCRFSQPAYHFGGTFPVGHSQLRPEETLGDPRLVQDAPV